MLVQLLATLILCSHCSMAAIRSPKIRDFAAYVREGDLNIGFFAKVHYNEGCDGPISAWGALGGEEVAYALENINNRSDILPNITLGLVVLDSCWNSLRALARAVYFLPEDDLQMFPNYEHTERNFSVPVSGFEKPQHYQVVGTIGLTYSSHAVVVSALMSAFHIPVLSTRATSDELSDKTRFPYFMRIVPPDRFVAEAMVDLITNFNWSYVSLLYSEGPYGENGAKQVERLIKGSQSGICIAFYYRMSTIIDPEEYLYVARQLQSYRKARVVLMISQTTQQRALYDALEKLGLSHTFLFVTGDAVASRENYTDGSITFYPSIHDYPGYKEYLAKVNPWDNPANPWLPQLWEDMHGCLWKVSAKDNKSCYNYPAMSEDTLDTHGPGQSGVYDGTFVYAYALHNLITDHCPEQFQKVDKKMLRECTDGTRLIEYMKAVKFDGYSGKIEFDDKGDLLGEYDLLMYNNGLGVNGWLVGYTNVGTWDKLTNKLDVNLEKVNWTAMKSKEVFRTEDRGGMYIPESVCSKACPPRHYAMVQEQPCCWECYQCRNNEIIANNGTGCAVCPEFLWPDAETATHCEPIKAYYLRPDEAIPIGLFVLALTGAVMAVAVLALVLHHRQHRLIRATSRGLSYLILLGSFLACCGAVIFITKPSSETCLVRMLGFHYSVCLLYSPLVVKTIRIYRIFSAGKRSVKRPKFVSSMAQVVITLIIIGLQTVVVVVVESLLPVSQGLQQRVRTESYVELRCEQSLAGFLIPVAFNLLLIITCALLGYMSRKLPENFNESWYIFISVATTLFMWIVLLPTYFSAFYAHHQAALLAFCLVLNAYITMGCLFLTKLYAIFCVQEETIKFGTTTEVTRVQPSISVSNHQSSSNTDQEAIEIK